MCTQRKRVASSRSISPPTCTPGLTCVKWQRKQVEKITYRRKREFSCRTCSSGVWRLPFRVRSERPPCESGRPREMGPHCIACDTQQKKRPTMSHRCNWVNGDDSSQVGVVRAIRLHQGLSSATSPKSLAKAGMVIKSRSAPPPCVTH